MANVKGTQPITALHDTEQDIQTSERITNVQKLEEKRLLFMEVFWVKIQNSTKLEEKRLLFKEVFWVKIQNSTKFILLSFVIISQNFN